MRSDIFYHYHHVGRCLSLHELRYIFVIERLHPAGQPCRHIVVAGQRDFAKADITGRLRRIVHDPVEVIQQVVVLREAHFDLFCGKTGEHSGLF